ncbi:MAG: sigma 54-dependent Fis family transcriptional regulator [Myxococcales bacterium]|nr:sigma 54-dependent Fis family transcriptional regulator [Myxococcales bacterium]
MGQKTRLVKRPSGSTLMMQAATLLVRRGPDKGKRFELEAPRAVIGSGEHCELCLADGSVSREHLEVLAVEGGYLLRDLGSTNGTFVGGVRLREGIVSDTTAIELGETRVRLSPSDKVVEVPVSARRSFGELHGESVAMRTVFAQLERVAPSDTTVLVVGESGTGKELAARSLHAASARQEAPFIIIDCGAMPPTLLEAELFGHERGAFTGADRARDGAFAEADGGTVFLDEIGELPIELQPRLLRFLERREVRRIGSTQHRVVDVRVIAATNRPLRADITAKRFREDLYYRLSVVTITLPPLRGRPEDIELLALHFAERGGRDARDVLSPALLAALGTHDWPGNARELRNVVERMLLFPELDAAQLIAAGDPATAGQPRGGVPSLATLTDLPFHEARSQWQDRFEEAYLAAQLERAGGVVANAAEDCGLPRQTFHRLMKKHGLRGKGR